MSVSRPTARDSVFCTVGSMEQTDIYVPAAAPPIGRLWTDADVLAFHQRRSIQRLMQEPDFPRPLAMEIQGRRWHPSDHFEYAERLRHTSAEITSGVPDTEPDGSLPEMDVDEIVKSIDEKREGGHRAKAA